MSLLWKPHMQVLLELIRAHGQVIQLSPASMLQKLEMERHCIVGTLAYHMCIAQFSICQMKQLEAAHACVLKGHTANICEELY